MYHLLQHTKVVKNLGSSTPPNKQLWKAIWKLPVIPKIRNFIWRLVKNILPTKANLHSKGILIDRAYGFCHDATENVDHLFMKCNFAKASCFSPPLGYRIPVDVDLLDWMGSILLSKDVVSAQILCTFLWYLWLAKNDLLYNQKVDDPVTVAEKEKSYAMEQGINLVSSKKRHKVEPHPATVSDHKGVVTIQVDVGTMDVDGITFGCVFKDH